MCRYKNKCRDGAACKFRHPIMKTVSGKPDVSTTVSIDDNNENKSVGKEKSKKLRN